MDQEVEKKIRDQTAPLVRSNEGLRTENVQLQVENAMLRHQLAQTKSKGETDRNSRRASLSLVEDAVLARREAEKASAALREREELFRLAIKDAPLPVIMQAEDGQVLQISETWTELTGYTPEDVPTFDSWLHHAYGPGADLVRTHMQRLFAGEMRELEVELDVTTRLGEPRCWAFSASAPGKLSDGRRFIVGMALDITERRKASQDLILSQERLRVSLQETEKARNEAETANMAKDNFLAILSHELRTPLTPVTLATRLLLRRPDLPESIRDALQMIDRNVEVESHLVNDLLDVTRISHGKLELLKASMDMHDAIAHAIEISRPDMEAKEQQFTLQLEASKCQLIGDKQRLKQVVWNVLKNASKFTPDHGTIILRTYNENERILVEISDTGIGMEPQSLAMIFDPFTQANRDITREFGGLGLGLAIARASLSGHDGYLSVTSGGLGRGSTFTISLPITSS